MTVLPVIAREMRAAARRTATYGLRINGAAALLAVCGWFTLHQGAPWDSGGAIFGYLHATLFLAIWVLVPFLAADCISRERREGTLPLLFLTPLKASDIVLAKALSHGLTAFSLWLAVLPVLTIPLITGGVSWRQAVFSVLVTFSSICLALGAGLVASAESKVHVRALLLAGSLGFCFCLSFIAGTGAISLVVRHLAAPRPVVMFTPQYADPLASELLNPDRLLQEGAEVAVFPTRAWLRPAGFDRMKMISLGVSAGFSALALWVLVLFVSWRLRRIWGEPPPPPWAVALEKELCTPVFFRRFLRRWMVWELERNPVGWLERRSWSGRLVTWSWLAVVISIYTSILANQDLYRRAFHYTQWFLAWILVGSVAVSAAGSFRREREMGMLELLLVAPLNEWQVLGGRVRGLWAQFLPAAALLLCLWLYCAKFMEPRNEWPSVLFFASTFVALPVVGLYFSLLRRNFLSAFLWTLAAGVLLPAFASEGGRLFGPGPSAVFNQDSSHEFLVTGIFAALQAAVAGFLAWRLHWNLKRRRFAIQTATGTGA